MMNLNIICACAVAISCSGILGNMHEKKVNLNTYTLDLSNKKLKRIRGNEMFIEWDKENDSINLNINDGPHYYPDKLYYSANSLMIKESKRLYELRDNAMWFPEGDIFLKFTQGATPWILKDYFGYHHVKISLKKELYDACLEDTVFHFLLKGEKKMRHYHFITDLYFSKCYGIIRMDYDVDFSEEKLIVLADFYDNKKYRQKILKEFYK